MAVEIISVGSEYIIQHSRNSGVAIIAHHLLEKGIDVDYVTSVTPQESRLEEVFRQAIARSALVFVISGLSSGEYDMAKKLLTRVLKKQLVLNYKILDAINRQFEARGEVMPRSTEKQALVPTDAEILNTDRSPVPGFLFTQEDTHVALLPGNEQAIESIVVTHILARLDPKTFRFGNVGGLILKTCGLSAAQIKDYLKTLDRENRNQTLNYVTDGEETTIILTVKADTQKDRDDLLATTEAQIRKKLGQHVYGTGSQTLEEVVGALLRDQKLTLALAESCTGGLISHRLTNIPGSSEYFERGVVSYSNDAKMSLLDVSPNIIEEHGAVSAETAVAMAEGVRWLAQTSLGLSVTGIAGPGGGTEKKPVGLVYIALASAQGQTQWQRCQFTGDRVTIKTKTAQTALNILRQHLTTRKEK